MTFPDIVSLIERIFDYQLFVLNNTPVTLTSILIFGIWLLVFGLISKILKRTILRVLSKTSIEEGTRYVFARIIQYVVVVVGLLISFQFIGLDLSGLAVIFGFLSVGVGFGLQNITSNFVAGLILLFERPIRVGDRLQVGDIEGDVVAINIRSTTIRSINNVHVIVPNSDFISNSVVNWSYGDKKVRLDVVVGVSYNSDLETVIRALEEVAAENADVMKKPEPEVFLVEFADSSWNMQLRVWIRDPKTHRHVRSALNCAIVHKFRQYNIEIPFPQRDLHLRSATVKLPVITTNES